MSKSLRNACIGEFIGTGFILFFGAGCVAAAQVAGANFGLWEISIVWGLGVSMAIYISAGISGAHLNPAVTIALAAFYGFEKHKILPYVIAQVAGAFCSVALIYFMYSDLFTAAEAAQGITRGETVGFAGVFSTYPNPNITLVTAFIVEFVITVVLMSTILAIGDDKKRLAE
ncbi:Aquaglyceroporin [Mannheimia haemolytica]|uniref:Aquaglyceroporin n=1 Tax=Mannheimia haemolytica TaxID=75985 RepID=A0A378MUD4_MANHA|nr:Aquaglyceroporin [Mannheimia haemolytica]